MLKKPVEAVQVEKESEINNGIQQLVLKDTYGEESGLNPLYLYSKTQGKTEYEVSFWQKKKLFDLVLYFLQCKIEFEVTLWYNF